MDTLTHFLTHDHRHCDDHYHAQERSVLAGDWAGALEQFKEFNAAMEAHLALEEGVLFPAFEEWTASMQGPTAVMRSEHAELRELLRQMEAALVARAAEDYAGVSDTFNILLQQHNMKEENILYPMMDRVMGSSGRKLLLKVA